MELVKTKVWEAAARAKDRPRLATIHYNANTKALEACDGWILAICPVKYGGDSSAMLPIEAVKEAQRLGRKSTLRPALELENGNVTPLAQDGSTNEIARGPMYPLVSSEDVGTYPPTDQIVPKDLDNWELVLCLDTGKLRRLADAICERSQEVVEVYRNPASHESPYYVKARDNPSFGLIMPIHTDKWEED